MTLPSPGFILNAFLLVCRRFPAVLIAAAVGVGALWFMIEPGSEEHIWAPVWMVCLLGLPVLTGLVVFSESRGWGVKTGWALQLLGLAALTGYAFLIDTRVPAFEHVPLQRYLTLLVVAHLFVAVAPYLNARSVRDFWEYNRDIFANFVIGAAFTLILYAGLALAVLAVDQLFDFNFQERIYMRLFFLLAGLFNTTFFLFHFPKTFEFASTDTGYHAIFRNLCKYILIPIVGLYFLILYTYGGKILVNWSLPRGWVSSLVLGFSVAGIFTYLLNFYLSESDDTPWVRGFRKWFWWVLLPLTVLLFVAIGKRIGDYGVTEVRFLVAHLGVWLAATCLYFLISKNDNIKFIPISLMVFGLVFAFGPFNAFEVSKRSQIHLLKNLLEKNGRWKDGRLSSATSEIPKEDVGQILSALGFLENRNALSQLAWLPMPVDSFPETEQHSYSDSERIADWAGIRYPEDASDANDLELTVSDEIKQFDVQGYGLFYVVALRSDDPLSPPSGYFFTISENGQALEWKQVTAGKPGLVESFDLRPVLQKWFAGRNNRYMTLEPEQTKFDLNGRKGALRVSMTRAGIHREKGELRLGSMDAFLFLKKK